MKYSIYVLLCSIMLFSCKNQEQNNENSQTISPSAAPTEIEEDQMENEKDSISVQPISHASFMMKLNEKNIFVDPVGESEELKKLGNVDVILLTDIHGDHFNLDVLKAITQANTKIIAPKAVAEKLTDSLLTQTAVLNNGESLDLFEISIKAIPMYNLREEAKEFHTKGRGNGYLLEANKNRIYISGDTEDIPEMRNLKNIDLAFVCMNLPYTMPVEAAADAVLDFKPEKVYPYHYRGKSRMSDVGEFKNIVTTNDPEIKVQVLDWYKNSEEK